jgi:hypothetical protein
LDAGIDDDILPPSTSVHRPSRTKRDPNKPLTPAQRALEAKAAKQAKEDGAATEPPAPAPAADTVPHKPATEPAPDKPAPDPEPRESDLSTED